MEKPATLESLKVALKVRNEPPCKLTSFYAISKLM